jgi:hypothetical protein
MLLQKSTIIFPNLREMGARGLARADTRVGNPGNGFGTS